MPSAVFPPAAVWAEIPRPLRLQIVSPSAEPPAGKGWLHEVKHDGHRLLAIVAAGELRLVSRNGHDRSELFREPFRALAAAGLPPLVLDGEIAVPDERGVTHIDALSEALRLRRADQFAYFAFDLLHLDGHDLRPLRGAMDEPTPEFDPPECRRCAIRGETARYGFGPPGFPLQPG